MEIQTDQSALNRSQSDRSQNFETQITEDLFGAQSLPSVSDFEIGEALDYLGALARDCLNSGETILRYGEISYQFEPTSVYEIRKGSKPVAYWFEYASTLGEQKTSLAVKILPNTLPSDSNQLVSFLRNSHQALFFDPPATKICKGPMLKFDAAYPFNICMVDSDEYESYRGASSDISKIYNSEMWSAIVMTEGFPEEKRNQLYQDLSGVTHPHQESVFLFALYSPEDSKKVAYENEAKYEITHAPPAVIMVVFKHPQFVLGMRDTRSEHDVKSAALLIPKNSDQLDRSRWTAYAHQYFECLFGAGGEELKEAAVLLPYIPLPNKLGVVGTRRL